MSEKDSKNTSLTDWERVDALTDEDIDTSDIPPLDDDFFAQAELHLPKSDQAIGVFLDREVVEWFKAHQGKGYQKRINAVLRTYIETYAA